MRRDHEARLTRCDIKTVNDLVAATPGSFTNPIGDAEEVCPDGFGGFGFLTSGTFPIAVGYSLYDDGYSATTLDGGSPIVGTLTSDTQLQYAPEPSTWMLVAGGLGLVARRLCRLR